MVYNLYRPAVDSYYTFARTLGKWFVMVLTENTFWFH